ncbi:Transcriptional regulator [Alteromonas macleodii]|tara:strand:- start:4321 stop:5292 length:972 start_codon:yes stop_codon:yes gene_type:complete
MPGDYLLDQVSLPPRKTLINRTKSETLLTMKSTIDIESLKIFRAVVEAGSFTAAGELLDKDKAFVSRSISSLEKRLGVQLLWRSTRRLSITEVGKELYERATGIITALEDTELSVGRIHNKPVGTLRLTCGVEFGTLRVNTWLAEYVKRYPDISVEAEYTNRVADIIHEGFDIAIRIGELPDSDLSARTIGYIQYGIYATPTYLRQHGEPKTIEKLESHKLIMFTPRGKPHWELSNGKKNVSIKAEPLVRVNNNIAARDFAANHLGIVLLPNFIAQPMVDRGDFEHLLHEWKRPPVKVSAVFTSSKFMTAKVRTFIELIDELW